MYNCFVFERFKMKLKPRSGEAQTTYSVRHFKCNYLMLDYVFELCVGNSNFCESRLIVIFDGDFHDNLPFVFKIKWQGVFVLNNVAFRTIKRRNKLNLNVLCSFNPRNIHVKYKLLCKAKTYSTYSYVMKGFNNMNSITCVCKDTHGRRSIIGTVSRETKRNKL